MSNIPSVSWDETSPAGSQAISLGDNRLREMKTQIREVIDVDHDFPSSGQASDVGQHKQVTLQEQADLGSGAVNATLLGSQTTDGKGELTYTDEDDNDVQITKDGNIAGGSIRMVNDAYLKAIDNAGTGTVDLIKANASDVPVLPDGAETATNAAPTSDNDIANKKYVDDQVATVSGMPSGAVILWSGTIANIPSGYVLCDGTNSTPDLTQRFVIGADSELDAGTGVGVGNKNTARITGNDNSLTIDSGTNSKADGGGTCTAQHVNMIPDYYALAYIMKT